MNPAHLIDQAATLAKRSPKKPRQADLRRAISACYYAVFHALCRSNADVLVGTGNNKPKRAWSQAYRAANHGQVKKRCKSARAKGFPRGLANFADSFTSLQELRHRADYDPDWRFQRSEVENHIAKAKAAIGALRKTPLTDRRAFAVHLLLSYRD